MQSCDQALEAPWVGWGPDDYPFCDVGGDEDEPQYCDVCGGGIVDGDEHWGCVM